MEWSEEKDVLLCREVLLVEPYKTKERTVHRAEAYTKIAENLNKIPIANFHVDKRGVRERLGKLVQKFKAKMNKEKAASGINPEMSELDILLEEITEKIDANVELMADSDENNRRKVEREKLQAEDMRLKAMESFGQTQKRKSSNSEAEGSSSGQKNTPKRKRSNGSELIAFLTDRANSEVELRQKEVEVKEKQHSDLMQMLVQQQQQMQQQQQQQFAQLQAVLAQQNQMFLSVIGQKKQ